MTDEPGDPDLRRRAAWLLAMLAVVALLFVLLLVLLSGHSGGSGASQNNAGPDDTLGPTSAASTSHGAAPSGTSSSGTPSAASSSHPAHASCPTSSTCALNYDIGNAVAAINHYRTQNGQQAVPGSVGKAAEQCALGNGANCSGGWAESQVGKPTGTAALDKIKQRGKLLDSSMTSFEVGWAYDPQAKQYYFAIVRKG